MSALVCWASASATVADIEAELGGETLGPIAWFAPSAKVATIVKHRVAMRLNPALGALESMACAFEYDHQGAPFRTKCTPREACGPELKEVFFTREFRAVALRTLPVHEEAWWRIEAPGAAVLHTWLRATLLAGCFYRRLSCQGANGQVSYAGAMAGEYAAVAAEQARAFGIDMRRHAAPRLAPHGSIVRTSWRELQPADTIVLGDAWNVLVQR